MNTRDRVREMYRQGAKDEQVAEWLFGPQWRMAATPKDGWELTPSGWAPVEPKRKPGGLERFMFSKLCLPDANYGGYRLCHTDGPQIWYGNIRSARYGYDKWLASSAEFWELPESDRRQVLIDADLFELNEELGPNTSRSPQAQQQQP